MFKFIFAVLSILLVGCGSSQQVHSKYQPVFDFSTLKSYSLFERNDEFSEWQTLSDANRNSIELAIEQTMEKSNLTFLPQGEADIVITYFFVSGSRGLLKRYNDKVKYCSYCLTNTKTGKKKDSLPVNPGSLIIDVIKPKSQRSIWRSTYPLKIGEKDNSQQLNNKVKKAISAMLNQLQIKLA